MADIEVARAIVTIVPTMEGAQQTITKELTGAANSSSVESAGKSAGSKFVGGLGKGLAVAGAATAAVAGAAVAAGKAFVSAAGDVAEYGDNIDKMSQKMGISAESYQEWNFVMEHCGTSMESLKSSMKTLASAAESGSEAFDQLGISQEEIANMSQEELFNATIAALQNVEDETTRTYLAGQTLGKGATELGALLNMTAEDTDALKQSAHDLGGIMSDEAVAAAAAYQDALQDMQVAGEGLKNNMMAEFLPGITGVMDGLADIFSGNTGEGLEKIGDSINSIVDQLTESLPQIVDVGMGIITALGEALIENLPALADAALQLLETLGTFLLENLPLLIDVGLNILMTLADGIIDSLPTLIPALVDVVLTIVDKLTDPDTIVKLVDASWQIMLALAEGLINALPKLIEKAPEIISNLVQAFVRCFPMILENGGKLILTLVSGIVNAFGKLKEVGGKVIQQIKDAIGEKIDQAKTWGKDLIDNFISGITAKIQAVKDAVGKVASAVKDFLGFSEPDEGPLSNFHTYAPDMLKLFSEGIVSNIGMIQSAMGELTGLMSEDMTTTVTAVGTSGMEMLGTDAQMSPALAGAGNITIPVYLGNEVLDTVLVNANQRINLRSGGIA